MKYHNKKVTVDGLVFDSKKEATRYNQLKLFEKQGIISDLQRQVRFELLPTQREKTSEIYIKGKNKGKPKEGKTIERPVYYIADFVYKQDGQLVVEDVKGYRKGNAYSIFTIKRKLMLYIHNISIKEV